MPFLLDEWLELVCPLCKGELHEEPAGAGRADPALRCAPCQRSYPIVLGIPDLRIFPDPYISIVGDWTKGRMLQDHFAVRDFAGIVELYFHVTPEVPEKDVRANTSRLLGGVSRAEVALESWERAFGSLDRTERLLDIGCGTAPLVAAAARRVPRVVGVDVAFRWLVIGKKRLEELGVRAPLVAACAEALPFRDGTFDVEAMQSTLEILKDQRAALAESARTLRPGGRLLVSTPNRLSVGPDPHIGVPAGGLLPWGLVSAIARLQMARPPVRRLLSAGSLGRRLREAGLSDVRVALPGLSPSQRAQFRGLARRLADGYEHARELPVAREALRLIGPLLQASGTKP